MDIIWKLFVEKIEDNKGNERDALTPIGKVCVPILVGVAIFGSNAANRYFFPTETTQVNVLDEEGVTAVVDRTVDTKLMEKQLHDQEEEMKERIQSVKDHATRDMRITTSERTLSKQEGRLEEMEDNYLMQQQVLLEIRDEIKGDPR